MAFALGVVAVVLVAMSAGAAWLHDGVTALAYGLIALAAAFWAGRIS